MDDQGRVEPVSGGFVTEHFEYDDGRDVTVYVPPDSPEAIVFAGDGRALSHWGAALESLDLPSTMVVGVHSSGEETQRLHEYSPGFDPDRFASHQRFILDDVRGWVRTRFGVDLPAARTAVLGISAGAELALALGVRHPELFGAVLCASVGASYRPPEPMPLSVPRAYLVAGTQEPFFLQNTTRWATALRDAGADVVMEQRVGGHDDPFAQQEFPLMVRWAFTR